MSIYTASMDGLPNEMIEGILFYLDGLDVAQTRAVCLRWYELVKGSIALQYRMELALEGYIEDIAHPLALSLPERVAALRRFTTCWCEFRVPADRVVELENLPELTWNCLPIARWIVDYGSSDHVPRIAPFPPADGQVGLAWRDIPLDQPHDPWDRMFGMVALSRLEMLITVGTQTLEDGRVVPIVRLLHADTFKPHPLVARHELPWPAGAELGEIAVSWVGMGLCNRTLSVTFVRFDNMLTITWNWRLGTVIHIAPTPLPSSPHGVIVHDQVLLSENVFCCAEYEVYPGSDLRRVVLFVFEFDITGSGDTRLLGRWGFPSLLQSPDADITMDIVTDEADEIDAEFRLHAPNPFVTYTRSSSLPVSVTDNIIGIRIENVTFYVLRSTFLRRDGKWDTGAIVPWEAWGVEHTRCLSGAVHAIHGCKALHKLQPTQDLILQSSLALNFTPTRCRAASSGSMRGHDLSSFVNTPTKLEGYPFREPISTRLPYFQTRPPATQDAFTNPNLVPIPTDAKLWWEEGRVVWATGSDGATVHVASL